MPKCCTMNPPVDRTGPFERRTKHCFSDASESVEYTRHQMMILGPQFTSAPPKFMVLRLKRTRVTHVMIEPVPCISVVYILTPTPAINNLGWEKEEKYSTYLTLGICWVCSFSCIQVLRKNLGVSVISELVKIVWEATKEVITCINVRVTKSSSPNKCNRRVYIYYLVKIFFPVEGLEIFCQRLYISDCRYPVHAPKVKKKKHHVWRSELEAQRQRR